MAGFGARMVDVTDRGAVPLPLTPVDATRPFDPQIGAENAERLRKLVERFLQSPAVYPTDQPLQGGLLYFPPGHYHLAAIEVAGWREADRNEVLKRVSNPFMACVVIPESVNVWFAPGAVLVLGANFVIDLRGDILAARRRIFDVRLGGYVILGLSLTFAEAEWWGASQGGQPSVNHQALQAALDSCLHLRGVEILGLPDKRGFIPATRLSRLPVTLRLNASYLINAPLHVDYRALTVVDRPDPPRRTVILNQLLLARGLGRLSDQASIVPAPMVGGRLLGASTPPRPSEAHLASTSTASTRFEALLICTQSPSFQVEGVSFYVESGAGPACVVVRLDPVNEYTGASQNSRFDRCSFLSSASNVVRLGLQPEFVQGGPSNFTIITERSFGASTIDLALLTFMRCDFTHLSSPKGTTIYYRAGNTIPLRFVSCSFQGHVATFLNAEAGGTVLLGCTFHNSRPYVPFSDNPEELEARFGFEAPNGADVFMSVVRPDAILDDAPFTPRYSAGGATFTSVSMVHCISRSQCALGSVRPRVPPVGTLDSPSLLLHLLQRNYSNESARPIVWGAVGQVPINVRSPTSPDYLDAVGPLVVIGARVQHAPMIYRGACQSVWLALRTSGGESDPVYAPPIPGVPVMYNGRRQWRLSSRT